MADRNRELVTRARRPARAECGSAVSGLRPRMVVMVIAALVTSWLVPGAVSAGPGLYLSWNDCPLSAASTSGMVGPCVDDAWEELVVSFELASPCDSVIALDAVVDVQSAAAALPPWWAYAPPSGCHYGGLIESADFLGLAACADFWQGLATYGGPPVYVQAPRGRSDQSRILASFAVLSSRRLSLAAGIRYYAARLVFHNDPTGACAGCETPACLVLNSIRLIRPPGTVGGDIVLESPGAPDSNHATWQSPQADCSAVPVRPVSWGRLKLLYR